MDAGSGARYLRETCHGRACLVGEDEESVVSMTMVGRPASG